MVELAQTTPVVSQERQVADVAEVKTLSEGERNILVLKFLHVRAL